MPELATGNAKLENLKLRKVLDLSLNDLRILVGSLRALSYMSEHDGENYLDVDARALKQKLEIMYEEALGSAGGNGKVH